MPTRFSAPKSTKRGIHTAVTGTIASRNSARISSCRCQPPISITARAAHDAVTMVIGTAIAETMAEFKTPRPSGTSAKASR